MNITQILGKTNLGKLSIIIISIGLGVSFSYFTFLILGYSNEKLTSIFNNPTPQDGLCLGWANMAQQLGMFGISWLLLKNQWNSLIPRPLNTLKWVVFFILCLGWLLLSYAYIEFSNSLNIHILEFFPKFQSWAHAKELGTLQIQIALLDNHGTLNLLQIIFLMAVVPGILEELFFRSILLRWQLNSMPKTWAIVLNGFIFSIIHFQFEGLLARWILGMMLGHVFVQSGRIITPILLHIANNFLGVLLYKYVYTELTFDSEHWIHYPHVIFISTIIFIGGWYAIVYLWRPKGLST